MVKWIQTISSQDAELSYPALFKLDVWLYHQFIKNIQIKHLHDIYIYKKKQIKLFSLENFLINKLNYKITSKMQSQISLIHFLCSLYYCKVATEILLRLLSSLSYQIHTNIQAISFSRWQYNLLVWVVL